MIKEAAFFLRSPLTDRQLRKYPFSDDAFRFLKYEKVPLIQEARSSVCFSLNSLRRRSYRSAFVCVR